MKAELEKHREELIKLEDDDPWHTDHQNSCPVKVTNTHNSILAYMIMITS